MHNQASLPAAPLPAGVPPEVLEAVVRAVAAALARLQRAAEHPRQEAGPPPMLGMVETARLLGVSRETVRRKAEVKDTPSLTANLLSVIRRVLRSAVTSVPVHSCAGDIWLPSRLVASPLPKLDSSCSAMVAHLHARMGKPQLCAHGSRSGLWPRRAFCSGGKVRVTRTQPRLTGRRHISKRCAY
jgi:hypothetical protein